MLARVSLHNPDKAEPDSAENYHRLRLSRGGDSTAIHTTADRARAMAFAFNYPEAVLPLIAEAAE